MNRRPGFSAISGRDAKAAKIAAILEAAGTSWSKQSRVLDVGTGSGHVAAWFSSQVQAFSSDFVDQRDPSLGGPIFVRAGIDLPFAPEAFDIVICNHVIEHVDRPAALLGEIQRVLRPGGVLYLATPNRRWPLEFHTGWFVLHWLPRSWFNAVLRRRGYCDERLHLFSVRTLKRYMPPGLQLDFWHQKVVTDPQRYLLSLPGWAARLLRWMPGWLVNFSAGWQPTLIAVVGVPRREARWG